VSGRPERLRDAHLHLAQHGEAIATPSAYGCSTLDEVLGVVSRAAREREASDGGRGGWVVVRSFRAEGIAERRFPTARELDDAAGRGPGDGPVVLKSLDLHSVSVSSAGLRALGITDETADPPAGVIERDGRGRATGVLRESAAAMLWRTAGGEDVAATRGHVVSALEDLRGRGIHEAHEMKATAVLMSALGGLLGEGHAALDGFRLKVYATPEVYPDVRAGFEALPAGQGVVSWGGLKLFTDGTVNTKSVFMLEPFAEPVAGHERGLPTYSEDELVGLMGEELSRTAARGGEGGVACHAIGDAAVRRVLDAYDRVLAGASAEPGAGWLRVEHAQFVDEADVGRFFRDRSGAVRRSPAAVSVQPCHLLPDMEPIERLLAHRKDRCLPLREVVDAASGAGLDARELVFMGSDAPVVDPEPADNVRAAVHRRRAGMAAGSAIAPEQALTEAEVWGLHGLSGGGGGA
jgi:hypothetical protein